MTSVILVIHIFLALTIIILVLLQRSEGGGLGIGGGGGGLGGLASPEGTANFLTRATGVCAGAFFCTSLLLGVLAGRENGGGENILDSLNKDPASISVPLDADAANAPDVKLEIPAVPVEKNKPSQEPPEVPVEK